MDRFFHVYPSPVTEGPRFVDNKGRELCNYVVATEAQRASGSARFVIGPDDLRQRFNDQPKAGKLCDWQIRQRCEAYGMLDPFVPHQVKEGDFDIVTGHLLVGEQESVEGYHRRKIVSYGLTSYGYDIRLADHFKVFNNRKGGVIDPLDFDSAKLLIEERGPYCDIAPNSYILGHTVERFNMPDNMVADCLGKSTYARCGLIVNVTPAEPGWEGWLTLELCNGTPCPIRVYANMGIAQMRFYEGPVADVTYADRAGKYHMQPQEPIVARV